MSINSFNNLNLITLEIDNLFFGIEKKIKYIQNIFKLYIEKPHQDDSYKVSLDILNYQSQLIHFEFETNKHLYNKFINQMYGHYLKLYNNICLFIESKNISIQINLNNDFEEFNDLEDNVLKFKIDDCEKIFNKINEIITFLKNYIKLQNEEIEKDRITKESGIYLNNFINQKAYDNKVLSEKTNFYINNLLDFYNFHQNFLKRMQYKLKIEKNYITNKINPEINENRNLFKFIKNYEKINKSESLIVSKKNYNKSIMYLLMLLVPSISYLLFQENIQNYLRLKFN